MQYKLMGSKIYLKKDVLPHKFSVHETKSLQLTSSAKRKLEFQEKLHSMENEPSTSKDFHVSSAVKRKLIFEESYQSPKKRSSVPTAFKKNSESFKETEVNVTIESPSGRFKIESIQEKETVNREIQVDTFGSTEKVDNEVQVTWEMKDVGIQFNGKNNSEYGATASDSTRTQVLKSTSSDSQSSHTTTEEEQSGSSFVQSSSTTEISDGERKVERKVTALDNIKKFPHFFVGVSKPMYYIVTLLSGEVKCDPVNILITLQRIRLADTFFRLGVHSVFDSRAVRCYLTFYFLKN